MYIYILVTIYIHYICDIDTIYILINEAQDGQDEAQDGQDEAQHAPKMGPGGVPDPLGPHQEHGILRNWSS